MANETVKVTGLKELIRACDHAGKETKDFGRSTFRKVGEIVRVDAVTRFADIDAKTAAGFRTVVRQRGVSVEERFGKTAVLSRRRPNWAGYVMRHGLEPALAETGPAVDRELDHAVDEVIDRFSR